MRPKIEAVFNILQQHGDWRQRKPLVLLARLEEQEGHLLEAIKLARRAVSAARCVPSLHAEQDRRYFKALGQRFRDLSRNKA